MSCSVLCKIYIILYKCMCLWSRPTTLVTAQTQAMPQKHIHASELIQNFLNLPHILGNFTQLELTECLVASWKKIDLWKVQTFNTEHNYEMNWCYLLDVKSCNAAYPLMSLKRIYIYPMPFQNSFLNIKLH